MIADHDHDHCGFLNRAELEDKAQHDADVSAKFLLLQETQRDKLCRGQQLRVIKC